MELLVTKKSSKSQQKYYSNLDRENQVSKEINSYSNQNLPKDQDAAKVKSSFGFHINGVASMLQVFDLEISPCFSRGTNFLSSFVTQEKSNETSRKVFDSEHQNLLRFNFKISKGSSFQRAKNCFLSNLAVDVKISEAHSKLNRKCHKKISWLS